MKLIITLMFALGFVNLSYADETIGEKVQAKSHNAKRLGKKGAHRFKERFCKKGDAKCLAKKGKHRVQEATETAGDKTKEVINKAD